MFFDFGLRAAKDLLFDLGEAIELIGDCSTTLATNLTSSPNFFEALGPGFESWVSCNLGGLTQIWPALGTLIGVVSDEIVNLETAVNALVGCAGTWVDDLTPGGSVSLGQLPAATGLFSVCATTSLAEIYPGLQPLVDGIGQFFNASTQPLRILAMLQEVPDIVQLPFALYMTAGPSLVMGIKPDTVDTAEAMFKRLLAVALVKLKYIPHTRHTLHSLTPQICAIKIL